MHGIWEFPTLGAPNVDPKYTKTDPKRPDLRPTNPAQPISHRVDRSPL